MKNLPIEHVLPTLIAVLLFFQVCLDVLATDNCQAATSEKISHQLSIRFDLEKQKLFGTSTISFPANTEGEIFLGALQNVQITNADGKPVVPVEETVKVAAAKKDQRLTVSYTQASPPGSHTANLITPHAISLTGMWHPVVNSKTEFHLSADIPANFDAVSEADTIRSTVAGNIKTVRFEFPHKLQYRHFIAAAYVVGQYSFGDNKELYTYFFEEDKALSFQYMQKTLQYLERYEKLIGPYPYKRFSVVENPLPTGYAMPTFTLLGQAVVRLPFITETSLGHEVLHSWFGTSIDTDKENWVEGLTTYLADQAYAEDKGEGAVFRKNQLIKYQSHVASDNTFTLKQFSGAGSHLRGGNEAQRAIGYGKGSMLFHMLKNTVGEDVFYKTLQAFYTVNLHKKADWQDIQKSFEKVSGKDLSDFFKQWLDNPAVPDLHVKDLQVVEKDGQPELTFMLIQRNEEPYELRIPLMITDSRGTTAKTIVVSQKENKVRIPLPRRPEQLIIDPNYDLMRRLAIQENPPVWSRFLGAQKKFVVVHDDDKKGYQYTALLNWLKEKECTVVKASEAKEADLATGSVIFLGTDTPISMALFAFPDHPQMGSVFDIRHNPLNPEQVAVLVDAEDVQEVNEALPKLRHYGKYSYLHFISGAMVEKRITESRNGIQYTVEAKPLAVAPSNTLAFNDVIKSMLDSRVIYVGENHTRYADHVLQLRVIRALYEQNPKLAIGMEMFNHTTQDVLDDYLAGNIEEREFLAKSHYYSMWGYDYRLYRDIINFARKNNVPIIALNIEKKVVSKVYKDGGLSALDEEESATLPPDRDLSLPSYRDRIAAVYEMHGDADKKNLAKMNNFIQAQAIWDETMANTTVSFLKKNPDHRMVVIAGQGHTVKHSGIPPRVARRIPGIKQTVLINAEGQEPDPQSADFLVYVKSTNLPPSPKFGVILEEEENRVFIKKLSPHGQAEKYGFKEGDQFLAIDNTPVTSLEDLKITMLYKKMGDKVTVKLNRKRALLGDKILELVVNF